MSTNLNVRRPSYFRAPSDTAVEMLSTEQRRATVPTLSSLAVLDYRRHSQPAQPDHGVPDTRRDSLPMFYATVSSSRRESLAVMPPSPTPSESASLAGGPHDTTPTASMMDRYGMRQPTPAAAFGYRPVTAMPVTGPPNWRVISSDAWKKVRRTGRDAAMMAALVGLTLWNSVLTYLVLRTAQGPVYNDNQLEDALIALDRRPSWRTEL